MQYLTSSNSPHPHLADAISQDAAIQQGLVPPVELAGIRKDCCHRWKPAVGILPGGWHAQDSPPQCRLLLRHTAFHCLSLSIRAQSGTAKYPYEGFLPGFNVSFVLCMHPCLIRACCSKDNMHCLQVPVRVQLVSIHAARSRCPWPHAAACQSPHIHSRQLSVSRRVRGAYLSCCSHRWPE